MPSNLFTQQYVSDTAPKGAVLGDEWLNSTTGKLYKQTIASGAVSWVDISPLPAVGSVGNILTSNGTSWISATAPITLPTQTSNNGKYLTTDGTTASWGTVSGFSTTDDVATNASYYPVIATTAGGNVAKTSSSKYYFNPSTGTLYATGFSSLSDENQKTNIVLIDNALTTVKQIESVKFEFKDGGKKSAGVIAQQLEQILPDLVSIADNGTKSVDYAGLIGYLIGAVKELSDKVELLEAK